MWTTSLNNCQRSQLDQTQNLKQDVGSHIQTGHDSSHVTQLPSFNITILADAKAFSLIFTFIHEKWKCRCSFLKALYLFNNSQRSFSTFSHLPSSLKYSEPTYKTTYRVYVCLWTSYHNKTLKMSAANGLLENT